MNTKIVNFEEAYLQFKEVEITSVANELCETLKSMKKCHYNHYSYREAVKIVDMTSYMIDVYDLMARIARRRGNFLHYCTAMKLKIFLGAVNLYFSIGKIVKAIQGI